MTDKPEPSPENPGGGAKPPTHPSVLWRLFFGFNCLLIVLNILSVPYIQSIGLMEIIDFTFTNTLFIALCGFMFLKPLGSVIFWRYFFYAAFLEAIIVLLIFPAIGVNLYGEPMSFNIWVLNILNTCVNLVALNLYAYKMRFIWVAPRKF